MGNFSSIAYAHLLHLFHVVVILTKQCSCLGDARTLSRRKIISLRISNHSVVILTPAFLVWIYCKLLLTGMNCQIIMLNFINMHAIVSISFWDRKIYKLLRTKSKLWIQSFNYMPFIRVSVKLWLHRSWWKHQKWFRHLPPTMIMTNKKYSVIVLVSWLELYLDNSGSEISGSRLDCPYLGFCRELSNRKWKF